MPEYYCVLREKHEEYLPICNELQCIYCEEMKPWPLVRLQDTPMCQVWLHFYIHGGRCPLKYIHWMAMRRVRLRVKVHTNDTQGWIGTNAS